MTLFQLYCDAWTLFLFSLLLTLTSQSWMSSMASRLLPWRSWNWMMFSAVCISSRSCPACSPVSHSHSMSCSSRPYLLMRCTGFSRYEDRSILSPSSCCFCCNSHHTTINRSTASEVPHSKHSQLIHLMLNAKICLKRTFYVSSCLFIDNMRLTRFLSSMLLWLFCKVNTEYLLCVSSGKSPTVYDRVDLFWQVFSVEICKSSCHWSRIKLLLNESFIPRARISKRMTSTFPNAVEIRPVQCVFAQHFTFYQINYFIIFFSDLFWGEYFPYYFTSFNRKELGRVHVCNTFHTNVQMLLLRVKEYWIHRLISLYL